MQNQLRIQIDNGPIQYLPDLGFHLMESPDILVPEQREYETERYPEHDGVSIYPYTSYESFRYTCKLLFFGSVEDMNIAVRTLWDSMFETVIYGGTRRAKEVRLYNDYKGVQIVGYAQAMPGEDSYIQIFGDGRDSKDSGWACEFTIFVANPDRCVWTPALALVTYRLTGAIPSIIQNQVRIGTSLTLRSPQVLGMQLPVGAEFGGWFFNGSPIETITIEGDISFTGRLNYEDTAFSISPEALFIAYDDTTRHVISVSCPDNTWQISAADPSWASVVKVNTLQAGITLSQNNGGQDREQVITLTWISPSEETMIRTVDIKQAMYVEVVENIEISGMVSGSDTGSGISGLTIDLMGGGIRLLRTTTTMTGGFSGIWAEDEQDYNNYETLQVVVAESTNYESAQMSIVKPTFTDAVNNGISIGQIQVVRKTQYVYVIYSIPEATPNSVQRQVVKGSTVVLQTPTQLGMTLPESLEFTQWTQNGNPVTQIIANSTVTVVGGTLYKEASFAVSPGSLEIDSGGNIPRTIHVSCPDNGWSVQAAQSWLTVEKVNPENVLVLAEANSSENERSQNVTFTWISPKGQTMIRTVTVTQLGYVEALETIEVSVGLRDTNTGTSVMGMPIILAGDGNMLASGTTNNNGRWVGDWITGEADYNSMSSITLSAIGNSDYIQSTKTINAFPPFSSAVANGIDFGLMLMIPRPDSYYIDTSGVKWEFNSSDNPVSGFSTVSNSITINGQSVLKANVAEMYFGTGYSSVTSLAGYFMSTFGGSGFDNLHTLDISNLYNVTSTNGSILSGLPNLTLLICGRFDASHSDIRPMLSGARNLSTSVRRHATTTLASAFVGKATSVSNWQVEIIG